MPLLCVFCFFFSSLLYSLVYLPWADGLLTVRVISWKYFDLWKKNSTLPHVKTKYCYCCLMFICLKNSPSPVSPSNSCFLCFLTSPPDCSSAANPVYCSSGPLLMFVLASMSISMSVSVSLYISASMSMSISHISNNGANLVYNCWHLLLMPFPCFSALALNLRNWKWSWKWKM